MASNRKVESMSTIKANQIENLSGTHVIIVGNTIQSIETTTEQRVTDIVVISRADYDAIVTPEPTKIYYILET